MFWCVYTTAGWAVEAYVRELNRGGGRTGDLFGWCSEGSCRVKRDWAVAGGCKVLWYILKMFS